MSTAEQAVAVYRQLETEDFRVLNLIEAGMAQHEFVPTEQIHKFSKLPLDRITYTLGKLNKLNLIYQTRGAYTGHKLNYTGYDCLAIHALVKGSIITSFGQTLGVGKEADVYDALTPEGRRIAVKFHRLGRISFRQTRRLRGYIKEHSTWLYQSHLAAEREFKAMKHAYQSGVAVPEPLCQNRHVIAMGMIEGGELGKYHDIGDKKKVLRQILKNVKTAYQKADLIHADLSEYNIILQPDGCILIIDWPQAVKTDHANAKDLLERDLKNVLTYFKRKFDVEVTTEEAYKYVIGEAKRLPI
ncbi:MAG TPA: RIO1 family regulatory kinase/ATPase [Candidatus Acidoferrales bacterium]|nr:RIO1 family regulatory kinase/ATPase [Candidatus Acidoferrales bacterium]